MLLAAPTQLWKVHKTRDECGFSEVKGQYHVRRAVDVAAAGGHNLFMIGSNRSKRKIFSFSEKSRSVWIGICGEDAKAPRLEERQLVAIVAILVLTAYPFWLARTIDQQSPTFRIPLSLTHSP